MQLKYKFFKSIGLLCSFSFQAHAVPLGIGIAYPPIHYKLNVPVSKPAGLIPSQVSTAYGFNAVTAQGEGQVIALVDAYDHPNIEKDLKIFSKKFELPACTTENGCFTKIYASGSQPTVDPTWAVEIALDVEWAHAMAPKAKIMLVEAANSTPVSLFNAVQVAVEHGATIVSMSWGYTENPSQISLDAMFNNPNVTFIAASGDSGQAVFYPAASPYVLSVGGTTLRTDAEGNYQSEIAWSGTGGGLSSIENWPLSQQSLPIPNANGKRGVPDVAYNADPNTGFSIYNSVSGAYREGWGVVGGTSAGAPQWAALVAIVNSHSSKILGGNFTNLLYKAANPAQGRYTDDFHDIDSGLNGNCGYYCSAQEGYDYLTGLGTPKVRNLIMDLANN